MEIREKDFCKFIDVLNQLSERLQEEKEQISIGVKLLNVVTNLQDPVALSNCAEKLYELLDDDTGFVVLQEEEQDNQKIIAFDCVIDILAITSKYVHEKSGQKYLPEPIELVSNETMDHLKESLKKLQISYDF